jgi:hypothetical protein
MWKIKHVEKDEEELVINEDTLVYVAIEDDGKKYTTTRMLRLISSADGVCVKVRVEARGESWYRRDALDGPYLEVQARGAGEDYVTTRHQFFERDVLDRNYAPAYGNLGWVELIYDAGLNRWHKFSQKAKRKK